jgi:hypothetical protein
VLESFVEDSAGFEELLMLAVDACWPSLRGIERHYTVHTLGVADLIEPKALSEKFGKHNNWKVPVIG